MIRVVFEDEKIQKKREKNMTKKIPRFDYTHLLFNHTDSFVPDKKAHQIYLLPQFQSEQKLQTKQQKNRISE